MFLFGVIMTLVNAIRFDDYIVRVLGIGYLFRLNESLKSTVKIKTRNDYKHNRNIYYWIVSTYTDIDVWKFFDLMYERKLNEVINNIVSCNVPESKSERADVDNDYIGIIVDEIAYAYGWQKDYILEKLTLDDVLSLRKARLKRESNQVRLEAAIAHAPKSALEYAESMAGVKRFGSLSEAIKYAKDHCDG